MKKQGEIMKRKYLTNGEEIEVIEKLKSGGYLVSHIYTTEGGEEEYYIDNATSFWVDNVFGEPPARKFSEKINRLKKEINDLLATKLELAKMIQRTHDQEKERLKKYQQYEQLKQLDDFLDGKITHYAETSTWNPRIIKAMEFNKEEDLKLLGLFGDSKGDLSWRVNDYKDGSGCYREVVPCKSYEEALSVIQKYIDTRVCEYMDDPSKFSGPNENLIKLAKKYKLKINATYVDKWREYEKSYLVKEKNSLIDEAKAIQAKIDELEEIKK